MREPRAPGGAKGEDMPGNLGGGPQICMLDGGMIPHPKLRDFVLDVAAEMKIPTQLYMLTRGATDGHPVHMFRAGVPSIYIGVPARYIHSHAGIIHGDDYEKTVRLLVGLVKRLDAKMVKKLTS